MNFKTTLPMLVHLANTDSGANIRLSQWHALEATLGPVDSMAWDAYQDQEYATGQIGGNDNLLAQYAVGSWLEATALSLGRVGCMLLLPLLTVLNIV